MGCLTVESAELIGYIRIPVDLLEGFILLQAKELSKFVE